MAREVKKWTKEENEKFMYLYNQDYSLEEIANVLGRSVSSVRFHSGELRLREHFMREVLFPVNNKEWDFFISKIKRAENKTELMDSLGAGFGEVCFFNTLEYGINENYISAKDFADIILRFHLEKTPAYNRFKRETKLSKRAII